MHKHCYCCGRKLTTLNQSQHDHICRHCWERWGVRHRITGWRGFLFDMVEKRFTRLLIASTVVLLAVLCIYCVMTWGAR